MMPRPQLKTLPLRSQRLPFVPLSPPMGSRLILPARVWMERMTATRRWRPATRRRAASVSACIDGAVSGSMVQDVCALVAPVWFSAQSVRRCVEGRSDQGNLHRRSRPERRLRIRRGNEVGRRIHGRIQACAVDSWSRPASERSRRPKSSVGRLSSGKRGHSRMYPSLPRAKSWSDVPAGQEPNRMVGKSS